MIRIFPSRDFKLIETMDRECFPPPDDPYQYQSAKWWVARESGNPVAYSGAKWWTPDNSVYLCRAGVLTSHRGRGIQGRMIAARVKWATSLGANCVFTYTLPDNAPSSNSLISQGFKLYRPSEYWAGDEALYWIKELNRGP